MTGKARRPISEVSSSHLDSFEANYRRLKKSEGGIYSLSEILLEKKRRRPSEFGVREVAAKIVELSAASKDGFVTYGEIWRAFRPDEPWEGHKCVRIIGDCLDRVIYYCVTHRLPIMTVLVVQASNRRLSAKAVEAIANECKELGIDVGLNPHLFIDNQTKLSRAFTVGMLPDGE